MSILLEPQIEEEAQRLEAARAAMARTRELGGRDGRLTAGIFAAAGVGDWGDARPYARSIAFACRLCKSDESREVFQRLLAHLEAHAGRLLHPPSPAGTIHPMLVLQQLAEWHIAWRKEPCEWRPRAGNAGKQFGDLLGQLLGPTEAARFRNAISPPDPSAQVRLLFGHLGRGENNRPESPRALYLTKKMGFQFLQAPERYDLIRALRWAQVYGLGGRTPLARAVDFTRLAWQLWEPKEEEFWVGVLQWLVNHPELDALHVTPIVDFVHAQRYGDPEIEHPPSPAFTMKGRAPGALLKLVEEWHTEVANRRSIPHTEFHPSGVRGGRWEIEVDGRAEIWTVQEILDSTTLQEEGRKMRHCVASYLNSIEKGKCSVWSMKRVRGDLVRRATTIQLNHASHRVVQCRGPCNRSPQPAEKKILKMWARENGLTLGV